MGEIEMMEWREKHWKRHTVSLTNVTVEETHSFLDKRYTRSNPLIMI